MREIGFAGRLLMLAFDHRSSFAREVTGLDEAAGADASRVETMKVTVYEGLAAAAEVRGGGDGLGLLVDEQYGAAVVPLAQARGVTVAVPVERSGREVFELEYGDAYMEHVRALDPDLAKVLVRFNPEGDAERNALQLKRLRAVGDALRAAGYGFLFELLVPPTAAQLEACGDDRLAYETGLRPALIVRGIEAIQAAGIEPDVWKVEGVEHRSEAEAVLAAARSTPARAAVACTVLGAGAGDDRVEGWLRAAAAAGFAGFAIGRSIWRDPVRATLAGELDRVAAIAAVRDRFLRFARVFEAAAGG